MKRLRLFIVLTAAAALSAGGQLMAQIQPCTNAHTESQQQVFISPELSAFPGYIQTASVHVGYGSADMNKHFWTSVSLGWCKICPKGLNVVIAFRRTKASLGEDRSNNDEVEVGVAQPGGAPRLTGQHIWTSADNSASNPVLSKSLNFTYTAAQINTIIFNSPNETAYLNFHVEDDTAVDSITISYLTN